MYYYQPFQDIYIDESSVGSKSRNPICQYLPNKHHARFGTKIWMLACSKTSYALKLCIYRGAWYDKSGGSGQGYYVTVSLMEMADIYNCGYQLFIDNLFTTYNTADFLLCKERFITGTMHHNQLKHLAKEIVSATPKVGEKIYCRKDNFLAMSYKEKKKSNETCYNAFHICWSIWSCSL